MITREGEIILKESYSSSARERFCVKPPDQKKIVVLEEKSHSDVVHWFTRIFLPQGYPESVSKDYLRYQIWDTAQAFCSTITGILATEEVMRGVGVGDTSATPLAATITWVFRDGCGHVGRILFAYSHGTHLDAYSKKWRLFADVLNDSAMSIEMALPLFKHYTMFALCVSTMMKAVVGVAGGATRAALTQHHAVRGNMADVAAKDSAQETAVNLVASLTALALISIVGTSLPIFVALLALHIMFNYLAVRAVCLRTLNEPRFLHFIERYVREEIVSSPCDINRTEPVTFYRLGPSLLDLRTTGFRIKLGCSIKQCLSKNVTAVYVRSLLDLYNKRKYILHTDVSTREMYIIFKEDACTEDMLCAYFHATILSVISSALNDTPLAAYDSLVAERPFAQLCRAVRESEWSARDAGVVVREPSMRLLTEIDRIAAAEWRLIMPLLKKTGWDLSKHLLMIDEWRISTKNDTVPQNNSKDNTATDHDSAFTVDVPDSITKVLSFRDSFSRPIEQTGK